MIVKIFSTVRNHWKKSIFFTCCSAYASNFFWKWHLENELMRTYCLRARDYGRQTLTSTERPRKLVVFLNPAAKDGKTKYLLEKHVLPILHLAGIEIHVVRTEHEGQAKAYMNVLDNNLVDGIVVAGGDGTLSEIVTGLLRRSDDFAARIPIGVLPFGQTNSYATELFPKTELEVERFCQASMAIVENKVRTADVIEVTPEADSEEKRSVYLMSHIKWGIHSDLDRKKTKYWYFPGALKLYYCYMKQCLFNYWPPHVRASLEVTAPCDGCRKCLSAEDDASAAAAASPPQEKRGWSLWNALTWRRATPTPARTPDPRLQTENAECGEVTRMELETPQLEISKTKRSAQPETELSCPSLEVRYAAPLLSKLDFITDQRRSLGDAVRGSAVRVVPHTPDIWYIMDSEKYETMPATIRLLRDKVKVYTT